MVMTASVLNCSYIDRKSFDHAATGVPHTERHRPIDVEKNNQLHVAVNRLHMFICRLFINIVTDICI